MKEDEVKTYIYTSPVLNHIYTFHPMMKFPSHTYISEEAIKECLSEEEFKELKLKLRKYKRKKQDDDT